MGFNAMYVGATGMKAHSTWMQAIGNNLANVNTLGFKYGATHFENLMSQELTGGYANGDGTGAGAGQLGKGVAVADIITDPRQGGFEQGAAATDLAIGGKGYFKVRADGESGEEFFYTRAGNFRFDKGGILRDPNGYSLRGMVIDRTTGEVSNTESDVALPMETVTIDGKETTVIRSDPRATSESTMIANLDSSATDNAHDSDNPFFSMLEKWDSSSATPLGKEDYAYSTGMNVYDAEGNQQRLIFYFDPVSDSASNSSNNHWEYLVTVDPTSADGRDLAASGTKGVYMAGSLTFNAAGSLIDQTGYTLKDPSLDGSNLSNWGLASIGDNGELLMDVTFAASNGALPAQTVGINFGLSGENAVWSDPDATAAQVGSNAGALPKQEGTTPDALAMTSYSGSSVTLSQTQNGYGVGFLQNVSIAQDGMLSGKFSNGQTEELFQINLYNFTNEYGLRHEGGNLYRAGDEAGAVRTGLPDSGNYGKLYQDTLETSNVDMSLEFTNMIRGQRGFQANSKVVTTTDAMLTTLIQVKR